MLAHLSRHWWTLTIRGVLALIVGLLGLVVPGIAVYALVILFGAYALVDGVFAFYTAFRLSAAKAGERFWFLFIEGILGIAAGLYVLIGSPANVLLSFALVLAWWAIVTGIMAVITAVRVRAHMPDEWLWILSGVLSVALGVAIFLFPSAGLIAFGIMFGAYATIAGITLIALSLKLRKRAGTHPAAT